MGCDIHSYAEVRRNGRWEPVSGQQFSDGDEPFGWRNYGMFGFLADVRNYSYVPVIAERRGIPGDVSAEVLDDYHWWTGNAHSATWLTLAELLAYDYDQTFWDRRVTRNGDGAALAEEGEGEHVTLREFLSEGFFADLETLRGLGDPADVRVVLWFDN